MLTPDAPPAWVGLHACARVDVSDAGDGSSGPLAAAARLADAARTWLCPVPRDSDVAVNDLEHGERGASARSTDATATASDGGSAAGARPPGAADGKARAAAAKAAMARLAAAKKKLVDQKKNRGRLGTRGANAGALGALEKRRSAQEAAAARLKSPREAESLLAGFRPNLPAAPTALGSAHGDVVDQADELELQRALALSLKSGAEA